MTPNTSQHTKTFKNYDDESARQYGLPQSAAVLAYVSALPLLVAALLSVARPHDIGPAARYFMIIYGGIMFAFFGGVRWGIAVMRRDGPTFKSLVGAVIPMVIAIPIFYLQDERARLVLIIAALPLLLLDDLKATKRGSGAPDWYLGVRVPLTLLMTVSFAIAFTQSLSMS